MSHSSFSTVPCIYSGLTSKYLLTTSGEDHWRSDQCGQVNMTERFHEVNEEGASQLALA